MTERKKRQKSRISQKILARLPVGDTVGNYKELCKILNEPVLDGNSKKTQLERWSRYFQFERVEGTQGYKIIQVYDVPLPSGERTYIKKDPDPPYRSRAVYAPHIRLLLLDYLKCEYDKANRDGSGHLGVRKTFQDLFLITGMVNRNYRDAYISIFKSSGIPKRFSDLLGDEVQKYEIENFFRACNTTCTGVMKSALQNMVSRKLIEHQEVLIVVDKEGNSAPAEYPELEKIIASEKQALKRMGFKKKSEVHQARRMREFNRLYKAYYRDKLDCRLVYETHKIKLVDPCGSFILTEEKRLAEMGELNATVRERVYSNLYIDSYQSSVERRGINEPDDGIFEAPTPSFEYTKNYEHRMELLIDHFL